MSQIEAEKREMQGARPQFIISFARWLSMLCVLMSMLVIVLALTIDDAKNLIWGATYREVRAHSFEALRSAGHEDLELVAMVSILVAKHVRFEAIGVMIVVNQLALSVLVMSWFSELRAAKRGRTP